MRRLLVPLATILLLAPLAIAHTPAGTPKNYCEAPSEWSVHDYITLGGTMAGFPTDGNLAGDCNGTVSLGDPCVGFQDPSDPLSGIYVGVCDFDSPVADWDGHNEYAYGGAVILACNGDGTAFGNICAGAGSEYCYGMIAHHAEYGSFTVDDVMLGAGAGAYVTADMIDAASVASGGILPPNPCGDFETDVTQSFTGGGTVIIPAGLDGAYALYVTGSVGHVTWP